MTERGMNLIIGGVHKAGTTSLYTYLSWHPEVLGSEIKETHFFSGDKYVNRYDNYEAYFKSYKSEKYKLEASPEYIYERQLAINNIKAHTDNPKLIFIFRNPTEKIISSFNHRKKNVLFDKADYSFEEFKKDYLSVNSLEEASKSESIYTKELMDGSYIDYIKDWFEAFDKKAINIIFFDDLKENPREVVMDVCKWLQIDTTFYDEKTFEVENKSVDFKNKSLQKLVSSLYMKFEPIFRKNYKLKNTVRRIYYSINVSKGENHIEDAAVKDIDKLYSQKNKQLRAFLSRQGYTNFPEWL